jgi:hypothetical protein
MTHACVTAHPRTHATAPAATPAPANSVVVPGDGARSGAPNRDVSNGATPGSEETQSAPSPAGEVSKQDAPTSGIPAGGTPKVETTQQAGPNSDSPTRTQIGPSEVPKNSAAKTEHPTAQAPKAAPQDEAAQSRASKSGARAAAAPKTAPKNAAEQAPGPAAEHPAAPLDLTSLESRLRDTKAIGVFTKLSLKNQVDALLEQVKLFHRGQGHLTLAELQERFNLLLLKVLSLLQAGDPPLARDVAASREALWGILQDPVKFAAVTQGGSQ